MHNLKGITTACSIWVSAGIGVACGSGFGKSAGGWELAHSLAHPTNQPTQPTNATNHWHQCQRQCQAPYRTNPQLIMPYRPKSNQMSLRYLRP